MLEEAQSTAESVESETVIQADTNPEVIVTEEPSQTEDMLPESGDKESEQTAFETEWEKTEMIKITVGDDSFYAKLEDNASANELRELLKNGPITMYASNYGGFEKVCSLGSSLTSDDVYTSTQAGDIMLYSSNQIVIFYESNSWAYTQLAKVVDEDIPRLESILSGDETEVVIELVTEKL